MNHAIEELVHEIEGAIRDLDNEDERNNLEQLIEDIRQTGSETTRRAAIIEGLVMFSLLNYAEALINEVL